MNFLKLATFVVQQNRHQLSGFQLFWQLSGVTQNESFIMYSCLVAHVFPYNCLFFETIFPQIAMLNRLNVNWLYRNLVGKTGIWTNGAIWIPHKQPVCWHLKLTDLRVFFFNGCFLLIPAVAWIRRALKQKTPQPTSSFLKMRFSWFARLI